MATLVCFHAHPDDETTLTGGSMARAAAEGHRVVLVLATDGAAGEVPEDLADGETLVARRRKELERSADVLGVHRVVWLDYGDSGMTGWEQNQAETSFLRADVNEAGARLAAILEEERADVLTVYDWHGNYGHPDHIKVHDVGLRAAELAATPKVFEATMNRDFIRRLWQAARDQGHDLGSPDGEGFDPDSPADDGNPFGMLEAELTLVVDVSAYVDHKRVAMRCHASQVSDSSFFMQMAPEAFAAAFGSEWFIEHNVDKDLEPGWLLA